MLRRLTVRSAFLPVVAIVGFATAALCTPVRAQIVESKIADQFGRWSDRYTWAPPEVPNNVGTRQFNVTLDSASVEADGNFTISNFTIAGRYQAYISGRLQVIGKTSLAPIDSPDDDFDRGILVETAGSFATASLTNFSDGVLTGSYLVRSGGTLQFNGADVTELSNAIVRLSGPAARIVDEHGQNGLRHLRRTRANARFSVAGQHFISGGDFTNDGALSIRGTDSASGSFSVSGRLLNFDPATKTLAGGVYELSDGEQECVLRLPGVDIVNNAASLALFGENSRIVNENGSNALQNFARNMPEGRFISSTNLTTNGNFRNDGYLNLRGETFKIGGTLTNFSPATKTLTGGTYDMWWGKLQFAGADIVRNGAAIQLRSAVTFLDENGANGLRNFAENLPGASFTLTSPFPGSFDKPFETTGDFTNRGTLRLDKGTGPDASYFAPVFSVPAGARYIQASGTTINNARLHADVAVEGGLLTGDGGVITGNVHVTSGTLGLSGYGMTVQGNLTTGPESVLRIGVGETFPVGWNAAGATFSGKLEIEVLPGVRAASTAMYGVLRSASAIRGAFTNAPSGTRLATVDGKGSFLVNQQDKFFWLSDYRANPPVGQLLNISTRANVLTGDNVLIGGFIVRGPVPKKVAVRAIGPSLAAAGITGALADPVLEVMDSWMKPIASNDNWRDGDATELERTGLAPAHDRDAAAIATLGAGHYTVLIRGTNNTSGVALVEVYDLSATVSSRAQNISTRGRVAPGEHVLIGGFIVGGEGGGNADVIVRAIGPSLTGNGVANALRNPALALYDASGTLLRANDNWRSDQEAEIIATTLPPEDTREAAIVSTLPPGAYTAIVSGVDNESGVGLVEVYDLNR